VVATVVVKAALPHEVKIPGIKEEAKVAAAEARVALAAIPAGATTIQVVVANKPAAPEAGVVTPAGVAANKPAAAEAMEVVTRVEAMAAAHPNNKVVMEAMAEAMEEATKVATVEDLAAAADKETPGVVAVPVLCEDHQLAHQDPATDLRHIR